MDQLIDVAIRSTTQAARFIWQVIIVVIRWSWAVTVWLARNPASRATVAKGLVWFGIIGVVLLVGWGGVAATSWMIDGMSVRSPNAIIVLMLLILLGIVGRTVVWRKNASVLQYWNRLRAHLPLGAIPNANVLSAPHASPPALSVEDIEFLPDREALTFDTMQFPAAPKRSLLDEIEIEDNS